MRLMKFKNTRLCGVWLAALVAPLLTPALAQPQVTIRTNASSDLPQAIVISVRGKCEYSEDGATFTALQSGHVFSQGVVVRTGDDARTDLFFRRIGTTVRIQAG